MQEGQIMSLKFSAFNVEYHPHCRFDHLTIVDRDGTTLMEKACGNVNQRLVIGRQPRSSLPEIRSRSNEAKLHFKTDRSVQRSGWRVKWALVTGECL